MFEYDGWAVAGLLSARVECAPSTSMGPSVRLCDIPALGSRGVKLLTGAGVISSRLHPPAALDREDLGLFTPEVSGVGSSKGSPEAAGVFGAFRDLPPRTGKGLAAP